MPRPNQYSPNICAEKIVHIFSVYVCSSHNEGHCLKKGERSSGEGAREGGGREGGGRGGGRDGKLHDGCLIYWAQAGNMPKHIKLCWFMNGWMDG